MEGEVTRSRLGAARVRLRLENSDPGYHLLERLPVLLLVASCNGGLCRRQQLFNELLGRKGGRRVAMHLGVAFEQIDERRDAASLR